MSNTEVNYVINKDIFSRIDLLDKKFAHFDKTLAITDKKMSVMGKGMNANMLGGKLSKGVDMLNSIPNLNTGIMASAAGMANPYVLAGTAIVAVGAGLYSAKNMAEEWNKGMSKANVTISETPAGLQRISDKLQKMPRYGTDMLAIPEAFNQIISGVGDVDKSMDILQYALKGSRAGFTDLATVADAGVNILNSVGNKVKGASEVYDVLFATLNKGKGEFKDIANYLPRIIPYSNQLGISFKETAAMFALMTSTGQTTEQTTMLLQNAFISLLDGKKRGNMEKFVKIFDHGKIRPFADVIGDLSNKMKGMSDQKRIKFLDKLGLDAQAASAFSVLTNNTDKLKEFTEYIKNSSSGKGALEKALGDSRNAGDNIDRIKGKWENWKMSLGQAVAPFWEKFTRGVANLMDWLEKVEKKTGAFSTAWKLLTNIMTLAVWPFIAIFNGASKLYTLLKNTGSFLENNFTPAWIIIGKHISVVTGFFKDLFFIVTETYDVLAKIVTLDWGGLSDNMSNFRNRDWATNGTKPQVSAESGKAMYDKLLEKGVKKDKLDAIAKKWGVVIPEDAKPKSLLPPGKDKVDQSDNGKDKDNKALKDVANGGTHVRNVTVTIQKQVEKVIINVEKFEDITASKIKRILEELLVTSVRDAEIALAH